MNKHNAIALAAATWTLGASLALGFAASHSAQADVSVAMRCVGDSQPSWCYPACKFEDGNPDGLPCIWTSPRTGQQYYNDSANYR